MLLQTTLRLAATVPIPETPGLRSREEREPKPIESGSKGGDARPRTQGEQAAILHFGAQSAQRDQARRGASEARSEESRPSVEDDASEELSHDERQAVEDLKQRDREVRAHEQTHRSVGGQYAGNIHLDHQVGPDGKRYAVSGSTPIDVSPVAGDPLATLRKMEVVQRAASAPASPSGADRQVAAHAAQKAQQARAELAAQRYGDARELARERDDADRHESAPLPPAAPEATPGMLLAVFA